VRPAVYATGVTVVVGGRRLVDGCDVTVGRGDWVTILGPNGAGKTTLLHALAGLTSATGRIELAGVPLAELDRRRRARAVAVVTQTPTIPLAMSVARYVLLGRTAHLGPLGREGRHDRAVVERCLAQLDLEALGERMVHSLSGGERQRVVLARGLAQEAPLLFLDEPTTALDVAHQQETLELIDSLRRQLDLTIVSTMHDLTLASQFGDHLVVVEGGRIVLSGPPRQVLTAPQIERHFGARVDVIRHRGSLVVIPRRDDHQGAPHEQAHA
jgi:iron complex transport system ATP-binding protein